MRIRLVLQHVLKDRSLIAWWLLFVLLVIILIIVFAFQIQPSELNVLARYSVFGIAHLYNDSWVYHLSFVGFGILVVVLHTLIALKLHAQRSAFAARLFIILSIALIVISYFFLSSVLGLAALPR